MALRTWGWSPFGFHPQCVRARAFDTRSEAIPVLRTNKFGAGGRPQAGPPSAYGGYGGCVSRTFPAVSREWFAAVSRTVSRRVCSGFPALHVPLFSAVYCLSSSSSAIWFPAVSRSP